LDWTTIFTSVLVSGGLFGVLSFFLKKSIDESLSIFFETVKEQRKGRIQEELRRQAVIFDRQSESLSTAVTLVYRIRNGVRDLSEALESAANPVEGAHSQDSERASREAIDQIRRRIQTHYKTLDDLLSEDRAYFPEAAFSFAHDTRHILRELDFLVTRALRSNRGRDLRQHKEYVSRTVDRLTVIYEQFVPIVQGALGIVKDA
jgi:hypothetical protein